MIPNKIKGIILERAEASCEMTKLTITFPIGGEVKILITKH